MNKESNQKATGKYLGIDFPNSETIYFCFLEKKEGKILNYHFFSLERSDDWRDAVDFIREQIKDCKIDKTFFRDFRWMPFAEENISQGWKIICALEYLLDKEIFCSVRGPKFKNLTRKNVRIKEFFGDDLKRKEDENFRLSWFFREKKISQEKLNTLLLANWEDFSRYLLT